MLKPIKNIESYGNISECGKVYNSKGKLRKTGLDVMNQVALTINFKRYLIKNLVAQTFIRDFDPKVEYVEFIDGNKNNLHYTNLEIKLIDRFKLSPKKAEEIRKLYQAGYRISDLSNRFNVSRAMISYVVNNIRYKK